MKDSQSSSIEHVQEPTYSGEIELYGDPGIATYDAKVPKFLIFTYCILPIWGVITLYFLWNGSLGNWGDRGYWKQLQIAANTTFPITNQNAPSSLEEQEIKKEDQSLPLWKN